ncbi:MASE1 domain-containing protein [Trichocoleus sp. FACHB-262]|uniref:sensor histidine kinase n=1 Tax=Trichocoleus sp. FACHB-262 TaxID=2692869 RepID=UPI00168777FA|nr:MASE1 domain-containing protein [Trichocoleus sp. FACHB-262]MBD2120354.1 MASE1 domain-containing protein [Trichocoleus sp. FACHB-262]
MRLKRPQVLQYLCSVALLAIAYFATAKISISMIGLNANATPLWPPAGIALAAFLLRGSWLWPGVILGDFLLVQSLGGSAGHSFVSSWGSVAEAVVAAIALRRLGFRPSLDRLQDVWGLIVAALCAPLINATWSTLIEGSLGWMQWSQAWENGWTLWLGDCMGILVATPALLICRQWPALFQKPGQRVEGAVWLSLLCVVSWVVFGSEPQAAIAHYPLEYLPFPLVVWGALRFGPSGAVLASLVVSGIAIFEAFHGHGPFFAKAEHLNQAVLFLQAFMGVVTTTALVLAGAVGERQTTAELLQKSEASLANAQRIAQLGNWDLDWGQQQLRWSDELYRILGFVPKTFPPDPEQALQAIHPDDRDRVEQALAQAMVERQPCRIDYRILYPDGTERLVCEKLAFSDHSVTGTVQDITERKQTEIQLQAASEQVHEALRSTQLLTEIALKIRRSLELDQVLNTTVTEVRQFLQADRVYIGHLDNQAQGYVLAESVSEAWPSVMCLEYDEEGVQEFRALFASGCSRVVNDVALSQSTPKIAAFYQQYQVKASLGVPIILGDEVWVLVANQCEHPRQWQPFEVNLLEQLAIQVAIAIQQGQLYQQVQALNTNLESQVEERTAQLQQKMQELQDLNHFKDIFLHAFSHDVRTSIMGMSLILKNLQNKPGDSVPVMRSMVDRMVQSNERQLNLINSLLEDQTSESQPMALSYEAVRLDGLVQDLLEELEPLLVRNQATVCNLLPANLPPLIADPQQLEQVFKNLITNALKHNAPGLQLTLKATVEDQQIRCSVEDNGVGMGPEVCDRLFKLYVRGLDNPHLTGIGLGLYLCRQIITAHGGRVGVESVPGTGAKFWFVLPLTKPALAGLTAETVYNSPSLRSSISKITP